MGMGYDRSQPFIINGQAKWPPVRGFWAEVRVDGKNYIVHAWANANGVTRRMRRQANATNARLSSGESSEKAIPEATIKRWSSKSHRVTCITLLIRKGVPLDEVQLMVDHDDPEMTRRYIESLDPLALERRNAADVIYQGIGAGVTSSGSGTHGASSSTADSQTVRDAVAVQAVASDEEGSGVATSDGELPSGADALLEMVPYVEVSGAEEQLSFEQLLGCGIPELQVFDEEEAVPAPKALDTQSQPCCKVLFEKRGRNPLTGKGYKNDFVLQGLMQMHCATKPEQMQQVLCGNGYHTTRKEITNFRNRQRGPVRSQA
jgi:hypothetical protein